MQGGLVARLRLHSSSVGCSAFHQCRCYSAQVLKGDALGPIHQDEHQSFRVRKHGKPLPLPPVLDPAVLSQRAQWQQTKAQPDVNSFTPFQKKLWENTYAHALASDVRQCRSTMILLPSALLVSLHPRPHPETSDPWLLPVNLTTTSKQLGPPLRFLGRRSVVAELGRKAGWKSGLNERFTQKLGRKIGKMVWREDMSDLILSLLQKNLLNKLRWHFRQPGRLLPCASPRPEDIDAIEELSCVLFFGSLKTGADAVHVQAQHIMREAESLTQEYSKILVKHLDPHRAKTTTHSAPFWYPGPLVPRLQPRLRFPPLELRTTDWKGRRVPVYSLLDLLGEDKLQELLQDSSLEGATCVGIRPGRHNVPVETLLLQLQAFLAVPGP
ncbi:hypothetical protein BDV95DRAFT_628861 [Massariosphaeria phaeospora]|uniref:Uncharacterized protein n=1 Tax=Massariosphaeria phaeospora TaxID=100035 RepID=A0A7C8M7B8_9PLEO|nr:hypothetical protein BDV95DRAFT_628861 [Massariosphaeria phaeospora]